MKPCFQVKAGFFIVVQTHDERILKYEVIMVSRKKIDEVWEKGKTVKGRNPDAWRKDQEGNLIRKGSYGTQGDYGWEIDHKNPK